MCAAGVSGVGQGLSNDPNPGKAGAGIRYGLIIFNLINIPFFGKNPGKAGVGIRYDLIILIYS